jgi:hypothetical protein
LARKPYGFRAFVFHAYRQGIVQLCNDLFIDVVIPRGLIGEGGPMSHGFGSSRLAASLVGLVAAVPALMVASIIGVFQTPDSGAYLSYAQMLREGPLPNGQALLESSFAPHNWLSSGDLCNPIPFTIPLVLSAVWFANPVSSHACGLCVSGRFGAWSQTTAGLRSRVDAGSRISGGFPILDYDRFAFWRAFWRCHAPNFSCRADA